VMEDGSRSVELIPLRCVYCRKVDCTCVSDDRKTEAAMWALAAVLFVATWAFL
jgi:hypothetical protein